MKDVRSWVVVSLVALLVSCSSSGATTIVGTWRRPGSSTMAEITMVVTGTPTAGTASLVGVSTNINSDPPCTQTSHFQATYVATATTFELTGTGGSAGNSGCTNPSDNMPDTPLPMSTVDSTLSGLSGTMTVTATQLTIVGGSGTTAFMRL